MYAKILLRLSLLAMLVGLAAVAMPAQDQSDDVAAAARKAREKQKNNPPPKKVVTNDDIPSAITSSAPAPQTSQGKQEGEQSTGVVSDGQKKGKDDKGKEEQEDPNGESAWRKRFQAAHARLATAERELDVLQRELDTNQVQYYSDPQKAMTQQHDRSDINEHTAKIDAKKRQVEELKQQISNMEDDLRKAGGDPGWAR